MSNHAHAIFELCNRLLSPGGDSVPGINVGCIRAYHSPQEQDVRNYGYIVLIGAQCSSKLGPIFAYESVRLGYVDDGNFPSNSGTSGV